MSKPEKRSRHEVVLAYSHITRCGSLQDLDSRYIYRIKHDSVRADKIHSMKPGAFVLYQGSLRLEGSEEVWLAHSIHPIPIAAGAAGAARATSTSPISSSNEIKGASNE
jgi:hypothetical protein